MVSQGRDSQREEKSLNTPLQHPAPDIGRQQESLNPPLQHPSAPGSPGPSQGEDSSAESK